MAALDLQPTVVDIVLRDVKGSAVQLGEGSYGKLIQVEYAGISYAAQDLKVDGRGSFEKLKEELLSVCHIWRTLNNPNIAQLTGVWYRDSDGSLPLLVTEMMHSSLRYLRASLTESSHDISTINLSILKDVSLGLRYLHHQRPKIVHCGITPDNILLQMNTCNHCFNVQTKITNVGVAKVLNLTDYSSKQRSAYLPFLPPEAKTDKPLQYEPSLDVFSFGTVVWYTAVTEAITENLPEQLLMSEDQDTMQNQLQVLQKSLNVLSEDSRYLRKMVTRCWSHTPAKRPTIEEFSEAIKVLTNKQTDQNKEQKDHPEPIIKTVHCSNPGEHARIAMKSTGVAAKEPITIPRFYNSAFSKASDETALRWKNTRDGQWQSMTYAEYKKLIYNVAKSFLKLGLKPHYSVGIQGFNSVEWFASCIGAVFAGGLSTAIYASNTAETCQHILKNSKAVIAVVENSDMLKNILEMRQHDKLPHLKAIVQYKGDLSNHYPETYTWTTFLELGKETEDFVIDDIIKEQKPEQCAMLMYTSGTTGGSKGVMLSHDNLTWTTASFFDTIGSEFPDELTKSIVSYLPTSHISGMLADMFLPVATGGTVSIVNPNFMKGLLVATMKEVEPTFFFATPGIWERLKEMVVPSSPENQTSDASFLFSQATRGSTHVSKKTKESLGLTKCKYMFVGADSMNPDSLKALRMQRLTVLEVYGLSETTGPHTTNLKNAKKVGSCGSSINGVDTKIVNKEEYSGSKLLHYNKPKNDVGEVACHGRNVFMGYLGMKEETKEAIDDEGWFFTGDIGYMDEDEFLQITCRIDDLITLHDGTKIVPTEIEAAIKHQAPFLSNVMLVGEKRKYLTCLLTLKCVADPDTGEATDNLQSKIFRKLGTSCTTVSRVLETEDKKVFDAIEESIEQYNTTSFLSNAQRILGWRLLPKDFTMSGGELGPTLKPRRSRVIENYAGKIEELYGNEPGFTFENQEQCPLTEPVSSTVECNCYGKTIKIEEHNVTVTIPPGAIEKGYTVEIEVAASLFGSYDFTEKCYSRISPFVWIGASYSFRKYLKVEVEHHAIVSNKEQISTLCAMEVCKGRKSGFRSYDDVMSEVANIFQDHYEIRSPFFTYLTKSNCTCVAKKSDTIPDDVAIYEFIPKNYAELNNFILEIGFCCNLKHLRKITEEIYEKEDKIKIKGSHDTIEIFGHQVLELRLSSGEAYGYSVHHYGHIRMSAYEIIYQRFQDRRGVCTQANRDHYPPSFKVEVNRQSSTVQLNFKYDVCAQSEPLKVLSTGSLHVPSPYFVPIAVSYSAISFDVPIEQDSSDHYSWLVGMEKFQYFSKRSPGSEPECYLQRHAEKPLNNDS